MDSDRVVVAFAGVNALGMLCAIVGFWIRGIPFTAKVGMSVLALACLIIWLTIGYYTMTKEP